MKKIVNGFLISIILLLLSTLTPLAGLFYALRDGDLYKNTIEESGLYSDIPEYIGEENSEEIERLISSSLAGGNSELVDVSPITSEFLPIVQEGIISFLDPALTQEIVDTNIDRLIEYVKFEAADFLIFFPSEKIAERIDNTVPNLQRDLGNKVAEFPICSNERQFEIQVNLSNGVPTTLDCLPEGIDSEIQSLDYTDISNSVLNIQNNSKIGELLIAFDTNPELISNISRSLVFLQDAYRSTEVVLNYLLLFLVLLVVMFIINNRKDLSRSLKILGRAVLIQTGLTVIIVLILQNFVLNLPENEFNFINNEFRDNFQNALGTLVDGILNPFLLLNYIVLAICVILMFQYYLIKKFKSKPSLERPESLDQPHLA